MTEMGGRLMEVDRREIKPSPIYYCALGQLQAGEISFKEADQQMSIHGDQLLAEIFNNGFSVRYTKEDLEKWVGSIGTA